MRVMSFASFRIAAGFAALLVLAAPALAVEPSALESNLVVPVDGVDKTLTLEEAMAALNIPSVSLALIDGDRIAFAQAYGASSTPETIYQAASLSKFVAAVGAMRLVEAKRLDLDADVNASLASWKVPQNGFDKGHPRHLARAPQHDGGNRRARVPRLCDRR
jgi:CubicO group peptidase (beta-lactamase class C family)